MKKSALVFLILTGLFNVALCALFGWHMHVSIRQSWTEAREYCREHYTDLSSINNYEEDEEVFFPGGAGWRSTGWIGLYRDANDTWKWSGGQKALFFNWSEMTNTSENNRCVAKNKKGWHEMNCETDKYYFYCFQSSLVLVKENKTWEEAMEHCRNQFTDLVSLPSESALIQTLQTSREAQTDHVWTGLRYLGDSWLWVDGQSVEYQAWNREETPQCPAWSRRCGTLSLEEGHWDSWDCADKLNFVCYVNT